MEAIEALFSGPGAGRRADRTLHLPGTLGWDLTTPQSQPVTFNFVTLYKQKGFIEHPDDFNSGWDLCKRLNDLQHEICRGAASLEDLVHYVALLRATREYVATNDTAFDYRSINFATRELDFELFVAYMTLSVRDVRLARDARKIETHESLVKAASHYDRASWFIDEACKSLCAVVPPEKRIYHGTHPADADAHWIFVMVPEQAKHKRPVANAFVQLRADMMRAEAAVCHRRAIDVLTQRDAEFAEVRDELLEATAVHVHSLFDRITARLNTNKLTTTTMAKYAGVMSVYLRASCRLSIARRELRVAELHADVEALGRAFRLLEPREFTQVSADDRSNVGKDLLDELDGVMNDIAAVRQEIAALRNSNKTSAFTYMDVSGISSTPVLPAPRDPAALDEDEPALPLKDRTLVVEVIALQKHYESLPDNQRFFAFLRLRDGQATSLNKMPHTALPSIANAGRTEFDILFDMFALQMRTATDSQREAIAGRSDVFAEIMHMVFSLGALTERRRWNRFAMENDDGADPDSVSMREAQELEQILPVVANYMASMTRDLDLPMPARSRGQS